MNETKRLLILGCGYAGTALGKRAIEEGWSVSALTRNDTTAEELRQIGFESVHCGFLDSISWHSCFRGDWDCVINCVSSAGKGVEGYQKSYLNGMKSLISWAMFNKVHTFIYTSSTSVYSQQAGNLDESAALVPHNERSEILIEAEKWLLTHVSLFERHFILRLSGIYGPSRHYLLNQLMLEPEELPGSGDYFLNLIHRDDIVSIIMRIFGNDSYDSDIFNVADGNPGKKADVVKWLCEQLSVRVPVFNPNINNGRKSGLNGVVPDRIISNEKAKKILGWSPTIPSYKEGFAEIIKNERVFT